MFVLPSYLKVQNSGDEANGAPLRKPDVVSGIYVIVAKQSMPSTERRQKTNITDCSKFAIDCLSSDKPCEPAADILNPGDHCRT
jgi:hypothetical protein